MNRVFKVILVGDGGVGKSSFLKKLFNPDSFEPRYIPTLGVQIYSYHFETDEGSIQFQVWDTAGQEKLSGLRDGYYHEADAAIIMYDTTSKLSYKSVNDWKNDIEKTCKKLPIVIVGNKCDIPKQKSKDLRTILISSKTGSSIKQPFVHLTRELTKRD